MLDRRSVLSAFMAAPGATMVGATAMAQGAPGAPSAEVADPNGERAASRFDMLRRFRSMYTGRHFELDLFDADTGYLQTTLADSDRMSLRFFVEYNNVWWFAIINGVDVPSIAYDPETDTGAIVLDIRYAISTCSPCSILSSAGTVSPGSRPMRRIHSSAGTNR